MRREEIRQACEDVADALAQAAVRCEGGDYQANYDQFVEIVADGDCANIDELRDREALYSTCIPSLEVADCQALVEGMLDESCIGQLIRYVDFQCEDTPLSVCIEGTPPPLTW
jgi:hypothetical protein